MSIKTRLGSGIDYGISEYERRRAKYLDIPVKGMRKVQVAKNCWFHLDNGQLHTPAAMAGYHTTPVFYVACVGVWLVYVPRLGQPHNHAQDAAIAFAHRLRREIAIANAGGVMECSNRGELTGNHLPCKVIETRVMKPVALAFTSVGAENAFVALFHPDASIRVAMQGECEKYLNRVRMTGG